MRKAIAEDILKICGIELKCAVLDDGTRVFEADSFNAFMEAFMDGCFEITEEEAKKIAEFIIPLK